MDKNYATNNEDFYLIFMKFIRKGQVIHFDLYDDDRDLFVELKCSDGDVKQKIIDKFSDVVSLSYSSGDISEPDNVSAEELVKASEVVKEFLESEGFIAKPE